MRVANLRAFIPTDGATVFDLSGNRLRLTGDDPVYDVHGCGSSLSVRLPDRATRLAGVPLDIAGETLTFSVTSVEAGQTIVLRRPGRPDVKESFPKAGIALDAPVPARPETLAALRGRPVELDVDFQPEQFGDGGATVARVAGVRLAKPGERGDCQLRLIE